MVGRLEPPGQVGYSSTVLLSQNIVGAATLVFEATSGHRLGIGKAQVLDYSSTLGRYKITSYS